jgi:microcystin-dependent protein
MRRVEHVRHNTSDANAFTGLVAEFTYVLDTGEIRAHNGSTPGGNRILTMTQNDARYQPINVDLSSIAGLGPGPGLLVKQSAGVEVLRVLQTNGARFAWTNPDGGAGNPSIDFAAAVDLTGVTFNNGTYNGSGAGLSNVQFRFVAPKIATYQVQAADDRSLLIMASNATTSLQSFNLQALANYANNFCIKLKSLNPRTAIVPAGTDTIDGIWTNAQPLRIPMGMVFTLIKDASGWFLLDNQAERIGEMKPHGHATPVDPCWLSCNGAAISRTDYANLFAKLGTTWGAGDGSTTFNLPNAQSCAIVGAGQRAGLSNRVLGSFFGEENHLLSVGEMPVHAHTLNDPTHVHTLNDPAHSHTEILPSTTAIAVQGAANIPNMWQGTVSGNDAASFTGMTMNAAATGMSMNNAGGGASHNNMQPSLAVQMYIRA